MARYIGDSDDQLLVRFVGEQLADKSIPIYELGSMLIAVQRIVHKAALHAEGRLEKGVILPPKERESLALQITSHRKGSDLWGVAAYLTDPAVGPIIQGLIVASMSALGGYAAGKIGARTQQGNDQKLIVNIYPEAKQIADRINNIGGIQKIEFAQPLSPNERPVVIDAETQDYIRKLEFELVPGNRTTITGVVTRIFPQSLRLDLQDAPGHYIRVQVEDWKLFERVRRLPTLMERQIRFVGTPMYRYGDTDGAIAEFRADRLILPRIKN